MSLEISRGIFYPLKGPISSSGNFYHTTLSAYLNSIPLLIYQSHYSILSFIFFLNLITHLVIIKIGCILQHKYLGYFLSLFFFLSTSVFLYSLKTWQVTLLPNLVIIFIYFFIKYIKTKKSTDLFYSTFFLSLTPHFHMSSFILFPFLFTLIFIFSKRRFIFDLSISFAILMLVNIPYLVQLDLKYIFLVLGIFVVSSFSLYFIKNERVMNIIRYKPIYVALMLVIAAICFYDNSNFASLSRFLNLLPSNNHYYSYVSSINTGALFQNKFISIEFFLLILSLLFFRIKNDYYLFLYLFLVYGVFSSFMITLFFHDRSIPHQWFIYALPITFISIALYCFDISGKRKKVKIIFCSFILITKFYFLTSICIKIKNQGGGGYYLATLERKLEILDYIYKKDFNPKISFINVDWYGEHSWDYLRKYFPQNEQHVEKEYVVFINNYDKDYSLISDNFLNDEYSQVKLNENIIYFLK